MIAAMTLSVIPVFAGEYDHPADSIWLQPDTLTGPVGTTFTILAWTNVSAQGFTWQCNPRWDTTVFQLNSIAHTAGDPDGKDWLDQRNPGPDTILQPTTLTGPSTVSYNATWNEVQIGGTCLGDDYVPGYTAGKLWRAEFEVIDAPGKYETLTSKIWISHANAYILDTGLGTVSSTNYDADYSQAWELPPSPWLAVEPDLIEYGPDPPSAIGEEFDVDIVIKSLAAEWNCHNATLDLWFNDTIIEMLSIVFDPLWVTTTYTLTAGSPGVLADLWMQVKDPTSVPTGDVVIATIRFNVTYQALAPPRAQDDPDWSPLDIENEIIYDTIEMIPTDPEIDGDVNIYPERVLELPYLEVSDVTMGPEPVRGEEFNVTVTLKNLDASWYLIGAEFRLTYPTALIEPVTATEGPFFPEYAAMQDGSLGSWFTFFFEPGPPAHILFGGLILPNSTGWWNPPAPEGEGVIAIITFKVLYQSYGEENMTGDMDIIHNLGVGISSFEPPQDIVDVPMDFPVNGTYTIATNLPGRVIDLYGGALNRGYGSHPFPAPYGGQGPDNPMDLIIPQAEVCLFAEVTYNYWPVQNKLVGFEVEYPCGQGILLKRTATTNEVGIAMICFEMPWPCDDPESLIGVWKVTATVDISDTRINDTLEYHYDYMVNIWKVTADKFEYNHCETVEITIEYGTHAQQWYPALLSAVILDELIVPIGMALLETEIGGAQFCSYTNFTSIVTIHIPKHAFAGIATIHVSAFDRDPTEGGIPWTPEFTPPPEIAIQPY
jgi:hypothetical protein